MSTNKYTDYSSDTFTYDYPYTWEERNKEYLKKLDDRKLLEINNSNIESSEDN